LICVLTAAGVVTPPYTGLFVAGPSIIRVSRAGQVIDIWGYGFGPSMTARSVRVTDNGQTLLGDEVPGGTSSHIMFALSEPVDDAAVLSVVVESDVAAQPTTLTPGQ
jgi:hypothetical protein